uniref:Arylsulfatase A n=1 Tax=Corvus moneduloides TaxID=1196302 RepID=A0A8U7MAI1_CORMO
MGLQGREHPWVLLLLLLLPPPPVCASAAARPSFVLVLADDLGFGDLGSYGHPSSATPHLDRLAARGLRFTDFYSSAAVCSPSRAALLTGRFQVRSGIYPGVFDPGSRGGLPLAEVTVAELLKAQGYATAMVGKWHLGFGINGSFLPVHQGFDHFLGVPYSHDQGPCQNLTCFPPDTKCFGTCDQGVVPLPLLWNRTIIQQPVSFPDLVPLYNKFSRDFIADCARRGLPFLLYYASHPLHPAHGTRRQRRPPQVWQGHDLRRWHEGAGGGLLARQDRSRSDPRAGQYPGHPAHPERPGRSCPSQGGPGWLRPEPAALWLGEEPSPGRVLLPSVPRPPARPLRHPPGQVQGPLLHPRSVLPPPQLFWGLWEGLLLPRALGGGAELTQGLFAGSFHSGTTPDQACHGLTPLTPHLPPLLFDLESDPAENYDLLQGEAGPEVLQVLRDITLQKVLLEQRLEFGESQVKKGRDPSLQPCCAPSCSPKPSCCRCSQH